MIDKSKLTRQEYMAAVGNKAAEMWRGFDENQKTGCRFGMFPAEEMRKAEKEGFDGRNLTVALMNEAEKNGGMRA
jgi:hypothetical protein